MDKTSNVEVLGPANAMRIMLNVPGNIDEWDVLWTD